MKKRIFSLLLCLAMLASLFPTALAAELEEPAAPETTELAETPDEPAISDALGGPKTPDEPETPDELAEPLPVRVVFVTDPENTSVTVYDPNTQNEANEPAVIDPQGDGSYFLLPGDYLCDAAAEGYLPLEKQPFTVEESETELRLFLILEEEATMELNAYSGTCGENLTWSFDTSTGTLTISGTGRMDNYSSSPVPWEGFRTEIANVAFRGSITGIGDNAFFGCDGLADVTIPESVAAIGVSAFQGCTNLASITLPGGMTCLDSYVFAWCSGLTSITLPEGVTCLGEGSFSGCTGLTSITLPESMTDMGDYAFYRCSSLESIVIPEGVTRIGESDFGLCSSLTSVTIPESVTSIGASAFSSCDKLADIYYGGTFADWEVLSKNARVNAAARIHCGKPSSDLTWSFDEATGTLTISGTGEMENYTGSSPAPWQSYKTRITNVVFQGSVTGIGDYAFADCAALTSITIPGSVTEIRYGAFSGCTALSAITFCGDAPTMYEPSSSGAGTFEGVTAAAYYPEANETYNPETMLDYGGTLTWTPPYAVRYAIALNLGEHGTAVLSSDAAAAGDRVTVTVNPEPGYEVDKITYSFANTTANVTEARSFTMPSDKVTVTVSFKKSEPVRAFVSRNYSLILGREGDADGIAYWADQLRSGAATGAQVVNGFVTSDEFKARGLSNEQIVEMLYQVMMGREADAAGKADWVGLLNDGVSPSYVVNGFAASPEFKNICDGYGIKPGSVALTENRDKNPKISAFVSRCYRLMMEREPDVSGLNDWCGHLLAGRQTGATLVDAFLTSPEFEGRGLSASRAVEILYLVMLDREADDAGKADWVAYVDAGTTLRWVVSGFAASPEFAGVCASYGIKAGALTNLEWRDRNGRVTQFVARCYSCALERQGDKGGLNDWCQKLLTKRFKPQQVAEQFVFSAECEGRNLSDRDFVEMLYHLYMGRDSDEGGMNDWLRNLSNGMTRRQVAAAFAAAPEFTAIVKSYGL